MGKFTKKIKKVLKKTAPLLALGLGAAALGRRNKKLLGSTEDGKGGIDTTRRALQAMTSNDAYNDDTMPGNLSRDMGMKRKQFMPGISENMYDATAAKGGRIVKPKGGGKAVRGLGRAFTKGRR